MAKCLISLWWAGQGSNLQPDRYERPALTIELPARPGAPREGKAQNACGGNEISHEPAARARVDPFMPTKLSARTVQSPTAPSSFGFAWPWRKTGSASLARPRA
jgi:hypothetical protein